MAKDYYKILELNRDATQSDIKRAYHRLAKKWHPDKNPDNKDEAKRRFQDIAEAYQILINDNTRRRYEASGGNFTFDATSDYFRTADDLFREFFGGMTLDEAIEDYLNDPIFNDLRGTNGAYGGTSNESSRYGTSAVPTQSIPVTTQPTSDASKNPKRKRGGTWIGDWLITIVRKYSFRACVIAGGILACSYYNLLRPWWMKVLLGAAAAGVISEPIYRNKPNSRWIFDNIAKFCIAASVTAALSVGLYFFGWGILNFFRSFRILEFANATPLIYIEGFDNYTTPGNGNPFLHEKNKLIK